MPPRSPRIQPPQGPALAGPSLGSPLLVWIALFWNVLSFIGPSALPFPGVLGQMIAQGMLPLALLLALLANPRGIIRPNLILAILSAMAVMALMVSLHNEYLAGATYRAVRFILFVAVLWLLTPYWGRGELPLLRAHLICLRGVVAVVVLGAILLPGNAFNDQGRLVGAIWPIPAPQVGHYSAVAIGLTLVLWFCGRASGRATLLTVGGAAAALLLSHTRTALAGLLLGLLVAGGSLFVGHTRVRRTAAVVSTAVILAAIPLGSAIVSWLGRGEDAENTLTLTGRTKVWTRILDEQRTPLETALGTGLTDKSYDGLPIDSSWLATYLELGLAGLALQTLLLIAVLLIGVRRPSGPRRAVALFLVTYCVVASFTETGLGDASPYLMELCVAGSALAVGTRRIDRNSS